MHTYMYRPTNLHACVSHVYIMYACMYVSIHVCMCMYACRP